MNIDLRDLFAAAALSGIVARNENYFDPITHKNMVETAYVIADEMIKVKEKE